MVQLTMCPPCINGDHGNCKRSWGRPKDWPKGEIFLGGKICTCKNAWHGLEGLSPSDLDAVRRIAEQGPLKIEPKQ